MGNGSTKKKKNGENNIMKKNGENNIMKKIILALFLILGITTVTTAHAADTIRVMYSVVDQSMPAPAVGDRYSVKWDHDLKDNYTADIRGSLTDFRSSNKRVTSFEIGIAKKFPINARNTVYIRPELGNVTPPNGITGWYTGVEFGYITKPFPDDKIRLKVDHAWLEGLNNDATDGTLSRIQVTYDVLPDITIGPRYEWRRGSVEFDALTLVFAKRF